MAEFITKIRTASGDKQIDYDSLANKPSAVLYTAQDLTDEQKAQARQNIGAAEQGVAIRTEMPKVFFTGDISGMSKSAEKILKIEYFDGVNDFSGYVKMKWQGNSSLSYPKKNFTIKIYSDSAATAKKKVNLGWGSENKYCLKGNYNDHSHARNVVSARIWSDIVKSRSDYASLPQELLDSPNDGAVDGYPFKFYMNGVYQGVYTWNIPKDGWMFNMDDENTNHGVVCGEGNNNGSLAVTYATQFRRTTTFQDIDGEWVPEFPDVFPNNLKTSLNNLLTFVSTCTDAEFKANFSNYADVQSFIDYYLYMYFQCGLDGLAQNMIMMTYDGTHWFASVYDMDSTWGMWWNGSKFVSAEYRCPEDYQETNSLIWQLFERNFATELKLRYAELRKGALSLTNVIRRFEEFTDLISKELYEEDVAVYPTIPLPEQNNIQQIRAYAVARSSYVDEQIEQLAGGIPCTSITLDSNSLIFSGVGSQTLVATVTPADTTDSIMWTSSDTSVAAVSNGVVISAGNGNATITATCGEHSATCGVVVSGIEERIPCTAISLDQSTLNLQGVGDAVTLVATVTPVDTTDSIVWTSSNEDAVTVVGGTVRAIADGSATITATCGEQTATCAVVVDTSVPCTGITLNKQTVAISGYSSERIIATPTPNNTTDSVVWTSSNEAVAIVADGVVTSVANGTATITATCGEYSADCLVTVSGITTIDWEADAFADASWYDNQTYATQNSKARTSKTNSFVSDVKDLQQCVYKINASKIKLGDNAGAFAFVWDNNGKLISPAGGDSVITGYFYAPEGYSAAVRFWNSAGTAQYPTTETIMPNNTSNPYSEATIDLTQITLANITSGYSSKAWVVVADAPWASNNMGRIKTISGFGNKFIYDNFSREPYQGTIVLYSYNNEARLLFNSTEFATAQDVLDYLHGIGSITINAGIHND